MAARIVDHLPLLHGLAAVQPVALQQRSARRIDFYFKRHSQLAAVAEHGGMDRWQARRSGIEIASFFKIANLLSTVGKLYFCAAANAPVTPTYPLTRLKHGTSITSLIEFIG